MDLILNDTELHMGPYFNKIENEIYYIGFYRGIREHDYDIKIENLNFNKLKLCLNNL